jgi:SGNH hydrolase-like domain, acetyltransferase AlgX
MPAGPPRSCGGGGPPYSRHFMSTEASQTVRHSHTDLTTRRKGLWLIVAISLVVMIVPGMTIFLYGHSQPLPQNWREGLEAYTKNIPLFQDWRRTDQGWRSSWLKAGNNRVHLGEEGWLYYRPDLEAVHGKGPFWQEPPSVARAPGQDAWQAPLPVMLDFAHQLRERGIRLIVVPVPTKTMMAGSGLGRKESITRPAAWERIFAELKNAKVEALDVVPLLSLLPEEDRYLRHDTHWTPQAMENIAELVSGQIGKVSHLPKQSYTRGTETHRFEGDLLEMLDLPEANRPLSLEPAEVTLHPIIDIATGRSPMPDPASPVILLGDSFVNIFDDPSLGLSDGKTGADHNGLGAGFAAHLAASLGGGIDVIAMNGGGATAVREELARRGDDAIRAKQVVVWVVSARDLLLPELPARRAGITWKMVSMAGAATPPTGASSAAAIEVTGILREVSFFEDPQTAPYPDAIYSVLFEVISPPVEGISSPEALVFLWAFRANKLVPTSRLEPGARYQLSLRPLSSSEEVRSATRIDDMFRPDLPAWFTSDIRLAP